MASASPGKAIPATVLLLTFGFGATFGFNPSPGPIRGLGLRPEGLVSILKEQKKFVLKGTNTTCVSLPNIICFANRWIQEFVLFFHQILESFRNAAVWLQLIVS